MILLGSPKCWMDGVTRQLGCVDLVARSYGHPMPKEVDARSRVIPRLIAACPDVEPHWLTERLTDDDDLPYIQASALARAVVAGRTAGDLEGLPFLFDEAERILADGDPDERELIVAGFLEDLQGAIGWAGADAHPFYVLLGPRCRAAWDELIILWQSIREKKSSGELPPGPFDAGTPVIDDPELRRIFQGTHWPPK